MHATQGESVIGLPLSRAKKKQSYRRRKATARGTPARRSGGKNRVSDSPEDTVGTSDREYLVPYRVAAVAAAGETALGDATDDFQEYLLGLQARDPLARDVC